MDSCKETKERYFMVYYKIAKLEVSLVKRLGNGDWGQVSGMDLDGAQGFNLRNTNKDNQSRANTFQLSKIVNPCPNPPPPLPPNLRVKSGYLFYLYLSFYQAFFLDNNK